MKITLELDDKKALDFLALLHTGIKVESTSEQKTEIAPEPKKVEAAPEQKKPEPQKPAVEEKPLTLEDVRKILTGYTRSGYSDQVKALVQKYGSGKLSAVKSENYRVMLTEAKYTCRTPLTKEEVSARIEELKAEGYSNSLPALFEHHNATGVNDLKSDYYASFMRDAEEIDHAGN